MRALNLFCVGVSVLIGSIGLAAERPTLIKTCDPRPDILPRPFYDNHTEYRAQYNRPRYTMGWLAYHTSRTSLEAMAWQENLCAGNYDQHHMPPVYKRYNYPKPWEALNVGARPDFASAKPKMNRVPGPTATEELEEDTSVRKSKNSESTEKQKDDSENRDDSKADDKETVKAAKELVPSPSDK